MTFFQFFDVPVYWPILLLYFLSLFVLTMKRQIRHMIKHRYTYSRPPACHPNPHYNARGTPESKSDPSLYPQAFQ